MYRSIAAVKRHFPGTVSQSQNKAGAGKPAAVLILIHTGKSGLEIVLTRRSEHLGNHPGQISLPGGSVEDTDNDHIHTALREAEEEIGLNKQSVEVLGSLTPRNLPSGFVVTPVVAVMEKSQAFIADPSEVDEIFTIPLDLVLNKQCYKRDSYIRNGFKRDFYYIEFKGYYIWGATAGILHSLAHTLPAPADILQA